MFNKLKFFRFIRIVILLQATVACVDIFRSPYDSFVEMMKSYVIDQPTIGYLESHSGKGIASSKYLMNIEESGSTSELKYHYAYPNIWKSYCYYYLVVNKENMKVIGWGFDVDKADPKKSCASSG